MNASSKLQVGGGDGRQRLMDDMFNRMPGAPVGPATATGVSVTPQHNQKRKVKI